MFISKIPKPDLIQSIEKLKKEKNAIVLAHYYQDNAIQDCADFIGDSLGLSQAAAKTDADIIVFAGVHFMAETAKIISPSKKVLLPDLDAGCSLADDCKADDFIEFKKHHPEHLVVSYINCSAAIKAESDIICTSSNAVHIVNSIPLETPIIFAPDKNLGRYVSQKTGRNLVLWDGACMVHEQFSLSKIEALLETYPNAEFIAHPECTEPVLKKAHFIGSTTALLNYSKTSSKQEFIVATESGILHQMILASPSKRFIPAPALNNCACNDCPHMKRNTIQKLHDCLLNEWPEIVIDQATQKRAEKSIQRMLDLSVTL